MDNWSKYSQSKATQSDVSGKQPTIVEYALIKVVDNSMVVFLAILTLLFAIIGLNAGSYATWFLMYPNLLWVFFWGRSLKQNQSLKPNLCFNSDKHPAVSVSH